MAFISETINSEENPLQNVLNISQQSGLCSSLYSPANSDKAPVVLVDKLNPHLRCGLCSNLYTDPVINVKCGHTFCRGCAFKATHCPEDGVHCDTSQLIINRSVVGQIEDLFIHCCNGVVKNNGQYSVDPSGCPEKIQLGKRDEHERACLYSPVSCPYSIHCGRFRKSELEHHLQSCRFIACEHKHKGCEYVGSRGDVDGHTLMCGYRGLQKSISVKDFTDQNRILEQQNKELTEEVKLLSHRIEQLEEGREKQQQQLNTVQRQLTLSVNNFQTLQQKYESLQNVLDQLMTARNRRSTSSPSNSTEGSRPKISSSYSIGPRKSHPSSLKVEKWEMPFQFKCIGSLRGHKDVVWCLAMYKFTLCSSGSDCLIKVWDIKTLSNGCIKTIEGHTKPVHAMVVGGDMLYSAGEDLTIRVWNMETMAEKHVIENAHDNIVTAMVILDDLLFTASHSLIKVWDRGTSLTLKHTITGLNHWVRALHLNVPKDALYSGSHNSIDIWDTSGKFESKGKIDHKFGSVYSLAISHQYVIAGTYNQNINVFSVETNEHVKALVGHIGIITELITSPSGRFLFSGSIDKSIQVWNLENMLPIQSLKRHEGSINALLLYGDYIMSGSEDREIKVFKHFQMQMGYALQT